MEILEQFIQSKTGNEEDCEDGFVITENYAGVIDGVTSKGNVRYSGKTPGRIAMEVIKDAVKSMKADMSMKEAFSYITGFIYNWYVRSGVENQVLSDPAARCCGCLILVNAKRREAWFIGDSQALIDGKYYCFTKKIDEVTASMRSLLIESMLLHGETEESLLKHDLARDMLLPILKEQLYLVNAKTNGMWTYSLLNGFPFSERHIKCIKLPEKKTEVVIASDGYPKLYETLSESEEYLAELLKKDPLLYRDYKSTKTVKKGNVSFDDRVYVKFVV